MKQLIGSIVNNRYRILSTLGIGGMSVVFRAYDLFEDLEVSLKVLRADRLGDQESRRRFYNESRAIALLSHPNIVNVHDVNFEGKLQYIVMEYVDGVTLQDRMDQKGKLSAEEAIHYLRQILSALAHAHEKGVIHHDIKPQNILLLPDATVKVTDFGIATVPNFEADAMSDEAVGSVHYISPEQARGNLTDNKSDLYSVGVMMYAMLTGKLPFDAPSPVDVARMQVEKPPYAPCKIAPELPIGFQQVIFRAMAKRPGQRYQDAATMLHDLERLEKNPKTIFAYPKEFKMPRRIKTRKGMAGFFRALFPEEEDSYVLSRNYLLATVSAVLLSVLAVFAGIGVMVAIVSNLYQEYVNVPSYVGMAYEDVEANYEVAKNFRFKLEYEYDNTVEEGIILEQSAAAGESVVSGSEIVLVISKGSRTISIPDLYNMKQAQASSALRSAGLTYAVKGDTSDPSVDVGCIVRTEPAAGEAVAEGTTVVLYVKVSSQPVTEGIMPKLVGMEKELAVTALYNKGFTYVSINEVFSDVAAGIVISQSVPAETVTSFSETVTITVSKGLEPAEG